MVIDRACAIPCNLCGSNEVYELSKLDRDRRHLRTVVCQACGLVWSDPRPIVARPFYERDYRVRFKGSYRPKLKHVYRAGKVATSRYRLIKPLLGGRHSLLDIGSGGGEFMYLMSGIGLRCTGIEPNHGYGAYSREEYGLHVLPGFAEDHVLPDDGFDLITMWHVLEHTEDPYRNLELLRRWLGPSGLLVVEVPNVEATCLAPIHRFHVDHLYSFNADTLLAMGRKAGLQCHELRLSPDGGNLIAFFIKQRGPAREDCCVPGNADRIIDRVRRHSNLRHYTQPRLVKRFFARMGRMLDEVRAMQYSNGKGCLDALYSTQRGPVAVWAHTKSHQRNDGLRNAGHVNR